MKFLVPKSVLLHALNIANKAIAAKSIIPALDNFKFDISGDKLSITGSNNEVCITTGIDIVGGDFKKAISLGSAQLIGLVKDLPEQPIEFIIEERELNNKLVFNVTIKAGKGVYIIPAEDGNDYPEIINKNPIQFNVNADTLIKGIDKTLFAASTDQLRPELTGIYVSFDGNKVTYTGTNAHILSTFTFDIDVESTSSFVIPAKVLSILPTIPHDDAFTVSLDKRSVVFQVSDDTTVKSVLIDSRYPDYLGIIPVNNSSELIVDRNELIGAIKRVSKFSDQITNVVQFSITDLSLQVTAENIDFGTEAKEELSHSFSGTDIIIGLGGKQILECLNKISTNEVYFYFSEPNRAVLLRESATDPSIKNNLMLIMPMFIPANNE